MTRASVSIGAALLLAPLSAQATLVVSGQYVELTGRISEPISIENGGRAVLRDAVVIAPTQGMSRQATVSMPNAESTFEMRGSSFLTSTNGIPLSMNTRNSVVLADDALLVAPQEIAIHSDGGTLNAVYLEDHATIVGNIQANTDVFIAGNSRVIGAVRIVDWGDFSMSGGMVTGGVSIVAGGRHDIDISGGRIDGGLRATGSIAIGHFEMWGGEILGGFVGTSTVRDANLFGGSIIGGLVLGHDAELSIWGGHFDAADSGWLLEATDSDFASGLSMQSISIYGGNFGRSNAGGGIRLDYGNNVDVYGYDLSLVNGFLSGFLSDGSLINLNVSTGADWYGSIVLHDVRTSVPEPSSLALFLVALGGLAVCRRRSAKQIS